MQPASEKTRSISVEARVDDMAEDGAEGIAQTDGIVIAVACFQLGSAQEYFLIARFAFRKGQLVADSRIPAVYIKGKPFVEAD